MTLVYLIRHASTGETRRATFPEVTGADPDVAGAHLDDAGAASARELGAHLPVVDAVWSSHAARTIQTARLVLRDPDERLSDLSEADFGRWAGRIIADVHDEDEAGLARWMRDPSTGPPMGETFTQVQQRAVDVLQRASRRDGGPIAMVTHGGFIRAALTVVSDAPAPAAWAFGVPPASVTVVESDDTGENWQIRVMGWQPSLPLPDPPHQR